MSAMFWMLLAIALVGADENYDEVIKDCKRYLMKLHTTLCTPIDTNDDIHIDQPLLNDVGDSEQWPWKSSEMYDYPSMELRRHKRNALADQCCTHACTIEEIFAYC